MNRLFLVFLFIEALLERVSIARGELLLTKTRNERNEQEAHAKILNLTDESGEWEDDVINRLNEIQLTSIEFKQCDLAANLLKTINSLKRSYGDLRQITITQCIIPSKIQYINFVQFKRFYCFKLVGVEMESPKQLLNILMFAEGFVSQLELCYCHWIVELKEEHFNLYGRCIQIEELKLQDCGIEDKHFDILVQLLVTLNPQKTIDLRNNCFTQEKQLKERFKKKGGNPNVKFIFGAISKEEAKERYSKFNATKVTEKSKVTDDSFPSPSPVNLRKKFGGQSNTLRKSIIKKLRRMSTFQ